MFSFIQILHLFPLQNNIITPFKERPGFSSFLFLVTGVVLNNLELRTFDYSFNWKCALGTNLWNIRHLLNFHKRILGKTLWPNPTGFCRRGLFFEICSSIIGNDVRRVSTDIIRKFIIKRSLKQKKLRNKFYQIKSSNHIKNLNKNAFAKFHARATNFILEKVQQDL